MSKNGDLRQELVDLTAAVRGHLESLDMMGVDLPRDNAVAFAYAFPLSGLQKDFHLIRNVPCPAHQIG